MAFHIWRGVWQCVFSVFSLAEFARILSNPAEIRQVFSCVFLPTLVCVKPNSSENQVGVPLAFFLSRFAHGWPNQRKFGRVSSRSLPGGFSGSCNKHPLPLWLPMHFCGTLSSGASPLSCGRHSSRPRRAFLSKFHKLTRKNAPALRLPSLFVRLCARRFLSINLCYFSVKFPGGVAFFPSSRYNFYICGRWLLPVFSKMQRSAFP